MPIHDWTRVEAGIFHAFHLQWIASISNVLNNGLLPAEYYALPEQQAAGFGPDVLTLQNRRKDDETTSGAPGTMMPSRPQTRYTAENDAEFYRRKKSSIVIRHISGDWIVAMVEIVSPGNKRGRKAFQAFLEKACELLEQRVHLLIVDPFPPGRRDPNGIHAAIWEEVKDDPFQLPPDRQITLAAYECGLTTRAYIELVAVGEALPDMPLFLDTDFHVMVPLEATYQTAFAVMPQRRRQVLEGTGKA